MAIVRHARIAERADEDRVERAQCVVSVGRNRLAGVEIVVGAPRQMMQIDPADRLENLHRLGDHLFADAVAGNDRDLMCHQRILVGARGVWRSSVRGTDACRCKLTSFVGAIALSRVGARRQMRVGVDLSRRTAGRPGVSRSEAVRGMPSSVSGESRRRLRGSARLRPRALGGRAADPSVQRLHVAVRVLSGVPRASRSEIPDARSQVASPEARREFGTNRGDIVGLAVTCMPLMVILRPHDPLVRSCLHRPHRGGSCRAITLDIDGQRRLADVLLQPRRHSLFTADRHQHQQCEHAHAGLVGTPDATGGRSSWSRRGR